MKRNRGRPCKSRGFATPKWVTLPVSYFDLNMARRLATDRYQLIARNVKYGERPKNFVKLAEIVDEHALFALSFHPTRLNKCIGKWKSRRRALHRTHLEVLERHYYRMTGDIFDVYLYKCIPDHIWTYLSTWPRVAALHPVISVVDVSHFMHRWDLNWWGNRNYLASAKFFQTFHIRIRSSLYLRKFYLAPKYSRHS